MANGRFEPFDFEEFTAFVAWVTERYGFWRAQVITKGAYKAFPEYQEWVQLDKPEPVGVGPEVPAPQTKEEAWVEQRGTRETPPTFAPQKGMKWEWTESYIDQAGNFIEGGWGQVPETDERTMVAPGIYQLPDGSHTDEMGDPLDPRFAQSQIDAYWKAQTEEPTAGPQWRPGELELQREQLGLQERQWQAGLAASPRDWIERWMSMQPSRGKRKEGYAPSMEAAREQGLTHWYPEKTTGIPSEERVSPLAGMSEAYRKRQEWIGWEGKPEDWGPSDIIQKAQAGIAAWIAMEEFKLGRPLTEEEALEKTLDFYEHQVPVKKVRGETRPKTPPTPAWLPKFSPRQRVGEPIKKLPTKVPSAQQWGRTPASVRQGVAGYADWAPGLAYMDILSQMEMALPGTAPKPRGWTPARQR